ncbi:MAG: reverse transcriptase family protein [Candidatus Thiodiazotropha endolucinida]|nr:reverse transcriptase family protein [Candidatus Thiodiazotropha taylori]MCW4346812.1 reverse transcriptase family protein [Candidatus Thiodiazotropha endolucinida]
MSRYRSGGIALIVKEELLPYIKIDYTRSSKLILFFTISKALYGFENHDEDLVCGIVYIPPHGSKYASEDPYLEIQEQLFRYCLDAKHLLLLGDFNSRSKNMPDYVCIDKHFSDVYGLQETYEENTCLLNIFEQYGIPLNRSSADTSINSYGYNLLEFCKNNNLFILNGRIGLEHKRPSLTCKNSSTIDYFLSTANVLPCITDFKVHEFSPLFSDAHCPITLTIAINCAARPSIIPNRNIQIPRLWNPNESDTFPNNIDIFKVSEIEVQLDKILHKDMVTKCDIDDIISDIGSVFESTAKTSFGLINTQKGKRTRKNTKSSFKPWFNTECFRIRNMYHKSRKMYNKYKTEYYKNVFKNVSKKYKRTLTKCHRGFMNEKASGLRNMKSSDPREYWKAINSHKKTGKPQAALDDFFNFFKSVNECDLDGNSVNAEPDNNSAQEEIRPEVEAEVNQPVTEQEVLQHVKLLKNNKSPGTDNIVNEHIKSTVHIFLPIYTKLFNLILDTGIIPESWSIGVIKPIYKNKGDPNSPENYRPITLLSCFGKLFTSIINSRLNNYADAHDTINWCQAGFRKKHSTSDNLFILHSLIDIIKLQHKKLYCCFVDFKQAFDTVWRIGLWQKLRNHGFSGKCFNLIQNLYKDIKSKVVTHEGDTEFFECNIGVRQGENLSPFLFSIFLNDLEAFLNSRNAHGITLDYDLEEIYVYLKIVILLYADDTVLFSGDEAGLRHALKVFQEYCTKWKMNVNTAKTKIIIFNSRTKPSGNASFTFNGQNIDVIKEYKYLGIYFSRSGSFTAAKKHIAEQANKAVFSLLKNIKRLELPFDIQIDLFDKTIKPILLYGCEIWGFGNIDVLERVQLNYFKYLFGLKKSTPSYMIYGELGVMPLYVDIQTRIISFWSKLIEDAENVKLSTTIYNILCGLSCENKAKLLWIENLKQLLCSLGFSGIWYSQSFPNKTWLIKATNTKIKDVFIQKWSTNLELTSNSNFYKTFKTNFEQSNFFKLLPPSLCKTFLRFRTRNHKLPVETGRWRSVALHDRKCNICDSEIGDEFHYLFVCSHFRNYRLKYLNPYFYTRPNMFKLAQLMNTKNSNDLKKLCYFISHITKNV